MTRITVVAAGSRGDVQPYVALGKGLRTAGYHVRILTSEDFAELVSGAGLEFGSIGTSIEQMLQSEAWRGVAESRNFLAILSRMRQEMRRRAQDLAANMPALFDGTDLILAGMGGFTGAFSIAEKLRIPVIQAYVFPITPTRSFASPLTPGLPFGKVLNPLSFRLMRQMLWQSSKAGDVATRRALGLPSGSFWGPYGAFQQQRMPLLYGYSPQVLPRPADWDALTHVTGYWFLDPAADWSPPADLVDFLNAGTPPVYIGFGSMGSRNPEESAQLALRALALAGQRGVIAAGWGGMSQTDLPDSVYMLRAIPHSWLFPHMAAVVHHGGAGTTAAGLRAGVPSIVVPFMGDQPFWGRTVAALGVGPAALPRRKLTAEQLAQAISTTISDQTMRQRAAALGERIRAEDGIGHAVAVIQQIAQI